MKIVSHVWHKGKNKENININYQTTNMNDQLKLFWAIT